LFRFIMNKMNFWALLRSLKTEHKQWEERLEQSNKNLAHFATMAAHDLQNPLRKLEKFSAHLRKSAEGKLNEEEVDVLRRMQQSIIQMQNLVRDLLELSHVGSQVQQFMPVKLADIVNEVIFGLQDTINETNGRVEIGEMIELDANPAQLRQLLENLIGNGLKYHKKDEPPVVRVAAQKTDETYCQIQVQDQGIGFNPEQAEKIFEIFERLHGNGTYPGTGIGLAICEKIAERHGGNIRAHGIPGEGASFIVDLPLTQPLAK
jgi:light-regulated signal transduction histidine kinase (bacteriophytochrome)